MDFLKKCSYTGGDILILTKFGLTQLLVFFKRMFFHEKKAILRERKWT